LINFWWATLPAPTSGTVIKDYLILSFYRSPEEENINRKWVLQSKEKSPLNLTAKLEETNIKLIEPFLQGIFSQMDGNLSGLYEINGKFGQPLIQGEGKIDNGQIMIDYLRTLYTFDGTLAMNHNQIIFKDFTLYDRLRNRGSLDGYLTHRNYTKFRINLDAAFTNFQTLNTTSKDNSLFYGQANATGNLNMFGPLSNMKISATARTSKGTRIYIPISGSESVEKVILLRSFTLTIQSRILHRKKRKNLYHKILLELFWI
jgi:hypothetical protein